MAEHNHDSQLEINNEGELLVLFGEEGNKVLYRKVSELYHPEFEREYVVLAEEGAQSDEDDTIELVPMVDEPNGSGDGGKLVPVKADEGWGTIEEVVNTGMEEQLERFYSC